MTTVATHNLGEPIKLTGVQIDGVAAEAAQPGTTVKIWTRLAITSDEPLFHRTVDNLVRILSDAAKKAGSTVRIENAHSVLLVLHSDNSADLWVDTAAVSLQVAPKHDVKAGTLIFDSDVADVIGMWFPAVDLEETDRIVYLFRQDWRFGLFFDFNPSHKFSTEEAIKTLGTLYRQLKYHHLYDMLANKSVFERLTSKGWFPFVEIIGREFDELSAVCEAGFDMASAEDKLLAAFTPNRVERMLERWIKKSHFQTREKIFRSAIKAFNENDPVAVLKIILTEIEGVLREAYLNSTGKNAKLKELLQFATDSAQKKAGAPDTLLLSSAFAEYLGTYTFAKFDPTQQVGVAGSRHAVGHGAASASSYTRTKALQALLTLDQLAFYT